MIMKKILSFSVLVFMLILVSCEQNSQINPPDDFVEKTLGKFSVGENKQIAFSPGNLQYVVSLKKWQFAQNQWEFRGGDNFPSVRAEKDGFYNNQTVLSDTIDLFGWGTGNNPIICSIDPMDYQMFYDWGRNKIDTYAPNVWRSLTIEEWMYLLEYRQNAALLYGLARVNGVNGCILLPDSWECPDGMAFKTGPAGYVEDFDIASYQNFSKEDWVKLEKSGAVFLPAAGFRIGKDYITAVQQIGYYWLSSKYEVPTDDGKVFAYGWYAYLTIEGGVAYGYNSIFGYSVRLVKDL